MNVICGVNGETWQQVELFLCHHCGMPVCAEHGVTIGADDAFDASQEPVSRAAGAGNYAPPAPQGQYGQARAAGRA